MPRLRTAIVVAACLATLSGVAFAGLATAWTSKDMTAAVKVVGYPKPHAKRVVCRGTSAQLSLTTWTPVRCVATYRHHRRAVFTARWQGGGGWVCAGKTAATCKLLRHGFTPTALSDGQPAWVAQMASIGYMANHYNAPQPFRNRDCPTATPPAYSFCYRLDTGSVDITVTVKQARAGYTFTAAATLMP